MRLIEFSDGYESATAPNVGTITATGMRTYADDTAFETALGRAPVIGEGYFNEGTGNLRLWFGADYVEIVSGPITITAVHVVASQAAMLALTAETGDVAVRSDENRSYILAGTDPTQLSHWQLMLTPTDSVLSVNGQTGAVSLDTDDVPEGATNKYHSADFTTALTVTQVATPAAPAAGRNKIYPKSDGKLYVMTPDGTETPVGSGAGGGVNFITNGDFESNANDWTTYNNAAAVPTTGVTGANPAPTLTFARTATDPINSTGSGLITAGAVGNGVSTLVSIAPEYRGYPVTLEFAYRIETATGYTDGDVTVWAIPVDGSNLTPLQLTPYTLTRAVGIARYRGSFQALSDATQYRIGIHQATAATTWGTIRIDSVKLGPQAGNATQVTYRISDFLAGGTRVTTTPTKLGEYRSQVRAASTRTWSDTNGAPTAAPSVANGIRIYCGNAYSVADTSGEPSKYEIFVGINKQIRLEWYASAGRTGIVDVAPSTYVQGGTGTLMGDFGFVTHYSPSTGIVTIVRPTQGGSDSAGHSVWTSATYPEHIDPYFDILVSEAVTSAPDTAGGRVIAMKATGTQGGTAIANWADVIFPTVVEDVDGSYNSTTGIYTVKTPGRRRVYAQVTLSTWAAFSTVQTRILKSGATEQGQSIVEAPTGGLNWAVTPVTSTDWYNAGDTIKIQTYSSTGAHVRSATAVSSRFTVELINGATAVLAGETVAAEGSFAATSVSGWTQLNLATAAKETHPMASTSTHSVVVPSPGWYEFGGSWAAGAAVAYSAGHTVNLGWSINSTSVQNTMGLFPFTAAGSFSPQVFGEKKKYLNAGDVIRFFAYSPVSATTNTTGNAFWSVIKVGE